MADPPKFDEKSRYTEGRGIAGAFEGETVTRRRLMEGGAPRRRAASPRRPSRCPRSASRSARSSRTRRREHWQAVGAEDDFNTQTYVPRGDQHRPGDRRAGKTTVYVRTFDPGDDDDRGQGPALRGDLHPLRPPRLPGALHPGRRRSSSARATAASTASRARSWAARRCGRSTASTRACATAGWRSATASRVDSELERFSPRDPSNHLDGLWQYLYPSRPDHMKLPGPLPKRPAPRRPTRARRTARQRRDGNGAPATKPTPKDQAVEGVASRRRLARRAHRRSPVPARLPLPQGPEGHELVLHARLGHDVRLPLAGGDRRVPGDVLRAGLPTRAYASASAHHQRRLPRRVRARHAQVGLDGDDHPDLPPHGPDVLLRRLQVPARAELGHRRRAARAHADDGPHRLPAAVRPALLLGHGRGGEHQRLRARSSAPTWPTSCAPAPSSAPTTISRFYALHMLPCPG